ncbi:hypothetical protein VTI74DRAFT_8006 [Chaetomium olivicolor]
MAEPAHSPPSPVPPRPPLHTVLPPLILGTATFNTQYVPDPQSMPYRAIVARSISLGVNAFDTSPYYGPSELLLGDALDAVMRPSPSDSSSTTSPNAVARKDLFLITKAGRIASTSFDYTPSWVRYSVLRSLQRLHTAYLDLVYMHDVEFVSAGEVLAAVRELRRLRDEEGLIRYVGISGFPPAVLCELAEMIRKETGEGLDAVLSYGHFTVQNRRLGLPFIEQRGPEVDVEKVEGSVLRRLKNAGVDVVLNASMLGMGLLTSKGIPVDPPKEDGKGSPLAVWHPSPPGLRVVCKGLAELAAKAGERLESVAIRWALAEWAQLAAGQGVGVDVDVPEVGRLKVGATVCGVSSIAELEETMAEWRGVLSGLTGQGSDEKYGSRREGKVLNFVRKELWPALGSWLDYVWESPGPDFVNARKESERGVVPDDGVVAAYEKVKQSR